MSWKYVLCKETTRQGFGDYVSYSLREAYMNDDGEIWGVTDNHCDPLDCLIDEGINTDEEASDLIIEQGIKVLFDIADGVIDLDTFVFARPDFMDDELIEIMDKDDEVDKENP